MRTKKARQIALGSAIAIMLLASVPALSASKRGTVTVTSPMPGFAISGETPVQWSWSSGTVVKSNRNVRVRVRPDGGKWTDIAMNVPIRDGVVTWDTAALDADDGYVWDDGSYSVRIRVMGTKVIHTITGVLVDNTAPLVQIIRPATSQVIVDDTTVTVAVVAGFATLEAHAIDNLSGVRDFEWSIGDEVIGEGRLTEYDFSQNPGRHTLTVTASDFAGNEASHSVELLALLGPSAALDGELVPDLGDDGEPGDPGDPPGPGDLPDPDELGLPDLDELGLPDLDELGLPDLEDLPDLGGLPDTSDLPAPPDDFGLPEGLPTP